jgi:antitoxin component YwqK of YwqJK toxin-antitoxin module
VSEAHCGQLDYEGHYKEDKRQGISKGIVNLSIKEGKLHGIHKAWREMGQLFITKKVKSTEFQKIRYFRNI